MSCLSRRRAVVGNGSRDIRRRRLQSCSCEKFYFEQNYALQHHCISVPTNTPPSARSRHTPDMFKTAASRFMRPSFAYSSIIAGGAILAYHYPQESRPSLLSKPLFPSVPSFVAHTEAPNPSNAGKFLPNLPTLSAAEVRQHNGSTKDKIYVGYGSGVYDVTDFVAIHPGGDYILRAAGGPLEPHWRLYGQHSADWVVDLLEEMRVANLQMDDQWRKDIDKHLANEQVWDKEPIRDQRLLIQGDKPFNAEPPLNLLANHLTTPNELFYVRNHMPVPDIDEEHYRLEIKVGQHLVELTINDLKAMKKVQLGATVQCAGNRRNELGRVKKVKGGSWDAGAISNAVWGGVLLKDVLENLIDQNNITDVKHVWFQGLDQDAASGTSYEASIPWDLIEDGTDVLLAYEMNGHTLPKDHGYPLRVIVPGVVGARSVKWLGRVTLAEEESTSHWQKKDYRSFSPDVDWDTVDFDTAPSIQEMPVISAVCGTEKNEQGKLKAWGYAWSGGGREVIRVDVSADGGKSWKGANLKGQENCRRNRCWEWKLWETEVDIADAQNPVIVCKATDSGYNTQPERGESIWNLRGLLNNSWHRVELDTQ